MDPDKVVMREVQGHGCLEVFKLPAERIGQRRKSVNLPESSKPVGAKRLCREAVPRSECVREGVRTGTETSTRGCYPFCLTVYIPLWLFA